ncbi:MAG: TRAP transporter substrate-binding protein [Alphaproteobacteria bacterium]
MKRRAFLTGAATGAAAALAGLPPPAIARGPRELTMIALWSRDEPVLGALAQRLARRIAEATGGEIEVVVREPGEVVPQFETFDAVSAGRADMYYGAEHLWQFKSRAFNFFGGVPYGLTASETAGWIRQGGGQELWDELAARYNMKPFLVGNTGGQMGGWFKAEIRDLEDYKRLRISAPGLAGEVLRHLGATAVATPMSNIVAALSSGFLDGAVGLGPWYDEALGIHRVAKFYYFPGVQQPNMALSCSMNLDMWRSLTEAQRTMIHLATEAERARVEAEFSARNTVALRSLRKQRGVRVWGYPQDIMNAIGESAGEIVAEAGRSEPMAHKIYASFLAYRRAAMSWSKFSDQAFSEARLLPFRFAHT